MDNNESKKSCPMWKKILFGVLAVIIVIVVAKMIYWHVIMSDEQRMLWQEKHEQKWNKNAHGGKKWHDEAGDKHDGMVKNMEMDELKNSQDDGMKEKQPNALITDINGTKIHQVIGLDQANVSTFIIETENKLVVIDAQMLVDSSTKAREYVDSLGKDVARVIVSHSHPDHYFGLGAFSDLPTYAMSETISNMKKEAETLRKMRAEQLGDAVPSEITYPTNTLEDKFTVDGLSYEVMNMEDTEDNDEALIKIPSLNAVFTGDLLLGDHLIIVDADEYLKALDVIDALGASGYEHILNSHQPITDFSIVEGARKYVQTAKTILDKNPTAQEYKAVMIEAYPDGEEMLDFIIMLMEANGGFAK